MALSRLYFITMDDVRGGTMYDARVGQMDAFNQIEAACRSGVRLVQLRMKEASEEEFLRTAVAAKKICVSYGCLLIINDRVEIAAAVDADGAHVGKEDLSVWEARRILGAGKIIGGTANTIADIREHYAAGADYVGLGPHRFTTTKKKLSPILGLEGYQRIKAQMTEEAISIPIFAIGGIELNDLGPLLEAGMYGVAFSGLLVNARDWPGKMKLMEEEIYKTIQLC